MLSLPTHRVEKPQEGQQGSGGRVTRLRAIFSLEKKKTSLGPPSQGTQTFFQWTLQEVLGVWNEF